MKFTEVKFNLTEIIKNNEANYANYTSYEAGDNTLVKITDTIAFSQKAKQNLRPRHPDRLGWLVGVHKPYGEFCFKIMWWGTKYISFYHHSFIKKHI